MLVKKAKNILRYHEDLEIAFHEIEKERDCPGKFEKLYYMAKELKNEAMAEHYKAKIS